MTVRAKPPWPVNLAKPRWPDPNPLQQSRNPRFPGYPTQTPPPKSPWLIVDVGSLLAQAPPATLGVTTPTNKQQQTVAGENTIIRVIYGTCTLGAQIAGVVHYSQFSGVTDLMLVCVWGYGPVDAIEEILINDAAVPAGVTVTNYLGTDVQNVDPVLVFAYQAKGIVFADHIRGKAYTVLRIAPTAAIAGFPRVTARIRGLKVANVQNAYVALNGTTQYVVSATSAQQVFNEDCSIEAYLAAVDWTPAADDVIVSKWNAGTNQRAYRFGIRTTGALFLEMSTNGTAVTTFTSSAVPSFTNGVAYFVRVEFKKTNGANSEAKFFTSPDSLTWTQLGTTQTAAIMATVHASTYEVRIGADAAGSFLPANVYYVRIDTPTKRVLEFLPWDEAAGASTWSAITGETWTCAGSATINPAMLQFSEVPALILADFLRSTQYGMGRRVDFKSCLTLYQMNAALVGSPAEPRHLMALTLDTAQPAETWRDVLRDYAHCWTVEEDGVYFLIRDANDGVVQTFDASNIVEGTLRWQLRGSRNQPTVVEVRYTDTSQVPWRDVPVPEYFPGVQSGTVPRRMSRIQKPGIKRYSEAKRYVIERLNDATLSDMSVVFRAFDVAVRVRRGVLISITHPLGFSTKPFRVLSCDPIEPGRWQITAAEFDPLLYSSVVVTAPSIPNTTLPSPAAPPTLTGLVATEDLVQQKDGLYISRIRVDWTTPTYPFVQSYRVEVFEGTTSGTLVSSADVSVKPFVTPPLKELVLYTARVSVVSTAGVVGTGAVVTITPQGKYLPPGDVPDLTGFEAGGRVFLAWGVAIDLSMDTIRYEIRYGSTSATWELATLLDRVSALTYGTPGFPTGTYRFFVKALDSVGMYSTNAASVDIAVSVDNAAFSAYTFTDRASELLAMTETRIGAARMATTDFGDAIGYGHATLLNTSGTWDDGTVPASTPVTQPHRSAMLFSPTVPRYVTVPYVASHNVSTTFYFEAWVYPLSHDATGRAIFSARTNNDAGGWDVRLVNGALAIIGTIVIAQSVETCPVYQWSHIGVKVTAGTAALYINHKLVTYASGPSAYTFTNNTNARYIGAIRSGAIFAFDGFILRAKLWNSALSDANRAISLQYDNDATAIGGMVGCWKGSDQIELSTSTAYVDSGTGASNGTIVGTPVWKSWSEAMATAVDLGQAVNGTFTVSGGSPTSIAGVVSPVIKLSLDGVTWAEHKVPTVVASARFFKYGYEAQGGSMYLNMTTLRGDVLIQPRTEMAVTTAQVATPAIVSLVGLYAKCIDLQLTYSGGTSGSPSAWFAVPDQVEVGAKGIIGGVYTARVGTAASATGYYTRASLNGFGSTMTVQFWCRPDDDANYQVLFDFPNDANTAASRLVFAPISAGGFPYMEGTASGAQIFALSGVAAKIPAKDIYTHVSVVANGTTWSLYYDGVLVGTCTYGSPASTSTARTWTIASLGASSPAFRGRMNDFRVWTVTRSSAVIIADMGTRLTTDANLRAYWHMNADGGDYSGNGFTLTPGGTIAYRPLNGFDVYLFDAAAARQTGDVRCRWTGA